MTEQKRIRSAIQPLLSWYKEHKKDLPWRRDPSPYHVWISEIMLQQTRIEAAIPYYFRFLDEVPDISSLAALSDDRLMKLWQGLGYYSRARNLKKTALILVENYGGELPADAAALRRLPGIGDYTAGAISSIAFGLPEPAVDGNVLRVLMRLLGREDDIALPETKKISSALLREEYPSGEDARHMTEAWMELGENLCIPNGAPKCESCPLASLCVAHKKNLTDVLPKKSPQRPKKEQQRTVLLIDCNGRFAIRKRPPTGLLANLWEFPSAEGNLDSESVLEAVRALGFSPLKATPCGSADHIFTHVTWHMTGFYIPCESLTESADFLFATPEEIQEHYAIPNAFRFFEKKLKNLREQ